MDVTVHEKDVIRLKDAAAASHQTLPLIIEIPIDKTDILRWLSDCPHDRKFYWCDRDREIEMGGAGEAVTVITDNEATAYARADIILSLCRDDKLIFIATQRFDAERPTGPEWRAFGADRCSIPEWLIVREGKTYVLRYCLPVAADSNAAELVHKVKQLRPPSISAERVASPAGDLRPASCRHVPETAGWREGLHSFFADATTGDFEKVVLARRTDYRFDASLDPWAVFAALRGHNRHGYAICFQPEPGKAFFSFTPERLFCRHGRRIQVDALSSTTPRGRSSHADLRHERMLTTDDKMRREHQIVVEEVRDAMQPLCRKRARIAPTTVMKLDRVQHLWTLLSGELRDSPGDGDILRALHPTPAVGGSPRETALEMIRRLEPFDRGWYAAPLGYLSRKRTDLAVAIRSGLIRGKTISVFAGAGIVVGSDPDQEWQELDSKNVLEPLLREGTTA